MINLMVEMVVNKAVGNLVAILLYGYITSLSP